MIDIANKYRENLIEAVAEQDEGILIKYLEGEEITEEELRECIRRLQLGENCTCYLWFFL